MGRQARRWLTVAAIAAAGIVLVAMAVPRLVAGIALVPGDPILRRVLEHRPVSAAQLDRLAESRRAALVWHERGRTGTDLGLALLLRAERRRILVADRDLEPARRVLAAALARAPASPHGWLRLAALEHMTNGATPAAAALVEMSVLTGPAEREILFPRLHLSLDVWDAGSARLRILVLAQLEWAWRADRRRTGLIARAAGAEEALRLLLERSSPEDLDALDRMLTVLRPAPGT